MYRVVIKKFTTNDVGSIVDKNIYSTHVEVRNVQDILPFMVNVDYKYCWKLLYDIFAIESISQYLNCDSKEKKLHHLIFDYTSLPSEHYIKPQVLDSDVKYLLIYTKLERLKTDE